MLLGRNALRGRKMIIGSTVCSPQKGVSAARNAALKNTITFMLTTAVEHTADVVQCRRKVDNAEGSGNVDVFQGVELTDHHDILDAFLCFQKNYKWTSTRRCK